MQFDLNSKNPSLELLYKNYLTVAGRRVPPNKSWESGALMVQEDNCAIS